jgi:membrane protease YdiL (CAAX protease family)
LLNQAGGMIASTQPSPDNPAPDVVGILLRVGLFVILGWLGWMLFPIVMYPLAGVLVTSALSGFAAASVANAITVRIYERGRLSDLGLGWTHTSLREFLLGMGAGAWAVVVILAGPFAAGIVSFEKAPGVEHPWASFAFVSIVLLFGAAGEEMLFHGYAFQLLVRRLGAFATILPSSVLFGLAHLGNQNVTALGILNTVAWGGLLGYAYLRTGALWLSIGLHFGWNFMLPLFGANLSGFTMGVTGYALHWRASDLWSGGAYGPEGSLLTTVIVAALCWVVWRVTPERE